MMSVILWDPDPTAFIIPGVGHPIRWYGICFASGFLCGYFLLIRMFASLLCDKARAVQHVDRLTFAIVIGTIVGARMGDVFMYDWDIYSKNIFGIFKVWEGGLSSHGGAIGVLVALWLALKRLRRDIPGFSYLALVDCVVVPTALVTVFIRIGNFFNQEILGRATSLPWAVLFGTPMDGSRPLPRHPAQLYEALWYAVVFAILMAIWIYRMERLRQGFLTGLFFVAAFFGRFCIEFIKVPQSCFSSERSFLLMGHYLSIPFILVGIGLLFYSITSKQLVNDGYAHDRKI